MQPVRTFFMPVSVLILALAAWLVPLPWYLEAPTPPVSLGSLVQVAQPAGPLDGDFLLSAVLLSRSTPLSLADGLIDDDIAIVPVVALVGDLPPTEYFSIAREQFLATADLAAGIGLQAAGYDVDLGAVSGDGAEVVRVIPDSAAEGKLLAGDVIIAVAGQRVGTAEGLRAAIAAGDAGATLVLTVLRDGNEVGASILPRVVDGGDRPILGIQPQTLHPRLELPIPVNIDSGRVGGPSAGLMIALTVYDMADTAVDLAAGRIVAGTGAISSDGRVIEIGGIRQKVSAAADAGAELFLAPARQVAEARTGLPSGAEMQIVGVENFDDAVAVLKGQ